MSENKMCEYCKFVGVVKLDNGEKTKICTRAKYKPDGSFLSNRCMLDSHNYTKEIFLFEPLGGDNVLEIYESVSDLADDNWKMQQRIRSLGQMLRKEKRGKS